MVTTSALRTGGGITAIVLLTAAPAPVLGAFEASSGLLENPEPDVAAPPTGDATAPLTCLPMAS